MSSNWQPKRSWEEVEKILSAPGSMLEMENRLIDGQVQRVFKNIWPSVRIFFLSMAEVHADKTNVVFEAERYTFRQVKEQAAQAAAVLSQIYGVKKGDRVAICSRNFPEFLIVFWSIHLLGAVPVLVNAWLPADALEHCLVLTECKIVFLDPERAEIVETFVPKLASTGVVAIFVLQSHEGKRGSWSGMQTWKSAVQKYKANANDVLSKDPNVLPEDDGIIIFTSGSTGLPKGVLLSQRAFISATANSISVGVRAALRRGEDSPAPQIQDPQPGLLLPTPLFHVTGTTLTLIAAMAGSSLVLMRRWNVKEAIRLIKAENISFVGGVPSTVVDLIEGGAAGQAVAGVSFGGAPVNPSLVAEAKKAFPGSTVGTAYGQTECNATAVSLSGEDYEARPSSCGRSLPINDVLIMKDDSVECNPREPGEIWIKGPTVMKRYWGNPEATAKTLTKDGWLRTGDIGYKDEEGFIYVKDRLKDIIIRGGENVDSVMVENALYRDSRVFEAAAVGVPDQRLGELVVALVTLKSAYRGKKEVKEQDLMALAKEHLPHFAVPVMILVLENSDFEHTPSEKIKKTELRPIAAKEWEQRKATRAKL